MLGLKATICELETFSEVVSQEGMEVVAPLFLEFSSKGGGVGRESVCFDQRSRGQRKQNSDTQEIQSPSTLGKARS